MRHRLLMSLVALLATTSCSSTPTPDQPKGPVAVTVKVQRKKKGALETLALGDKWKDGDEVALSVSAEDNAEVYLLFFGADGSEMVLAPNAGQRIRLGAQQAERIPDKGFKVKSCRGADRVFVVLSQGALSLADPKLYNAVDRIQTWPKKGRDCNAPLVPMPPPLPLPAAGEGGGATTPAPVTTPPPKPVAPKPEDLNVTTFASRAVCAGRDECVGARQLKVTGDAYVATFDPTGVAVIELSFNHDGK